MKLRTLQLAGVALAALLAAAPAAAQTATHGSATWSPAPGSGDWNTGGNWVPATVPNGTADTATFGPSTTTAVTLSQNTTVNGITFNATAVNPYTITAAPGTSLTISGSGVANNSGVAQSFIANATGTTTANARYGAIYFTGNANAGNSALTSFTTVGGFAISTATDNSSGRLIFSGTSSAGRATINNNASTIGGSMSGGFAVNGVGGFTEFFGNSTAGTSTIYNNSSEMGQSSGGLTVFRDAATAGNSTLYALGSKNGSTLSSSGAIAFQINSSAGNASINVTGHGDLTSGSRYYTGGVVRFSDTATAANATIADTGGLVLFIDSGTAGNSTIQANSGRVEFDDQSDGGMARIVMSGSATLALSGLNNEDDSSGRAVYTHRGLGIGSVEGSGTIALGGNTLTVGSNNLSTTFAGVINTVDDLGFKFSDTDANALVKVGSGTLTLSGASTYTGPTTVNAGTLSVTGSLVSPVTVNTGATLTNSGTIGGLTLAAGGTLASTGTPTTLTDTGAGSFAKGSIVNLDITAAGANDRIAANGAVSLGGATLNILAMPGSYTGTSYTLLTATGGLTGTFAFGGITGGTFATQPTLSYTANSVLLNFAALVAAPTHGSAVWKLGPTSGDWNTAANWANNTVPNGPADVATFDKTSIPGVSLSQNTEVNGIVFNAGASANPYTITAAPGTTLTISGAGVVNDSGVAQNFVAGVNPTMVGEIVFANSASAGSSALTKLTTLGGTTSGASNFFNSAGALLFTDSSTAGSATLINNGGTPGFGFGGNTLFVTKSSAGSATITNNPGDPGSASGGSTVFDENSSAALSVINVVGGNSPSASGGALVFGDTATAANATVNLSGTNAEGQDRPYTITRNGIVTSTVASSNAAVLSVLNNSTLASSTINNQGGRVQFKDFADGGTARIIQSANGVVDISGIYQENLIGGVYTDAPRLTKIGSIEGSGLIRLGANTLALGGNGLTVTFSGSVTDGGRYVAGNSGASTGGAVVKAGTGTLTLSGASTYTGATAVNAGTLSVTGSLVSPVTVNAGATLTVSGKVGGVTIASGGTLATLGTPQTMAVTGAASFAAGSTVKLVVTPAAGNDQIAVAGAAQLGGATLQVAASPGAYGTQRYTLLSAAGGVSGTFAFGGVSGLGTLSALVTPSLVYSPTSVVLAFQRVQIPGGTFNQRAVAGALNADALTAPLLLALTANGLPGNAQLDQASGELHATLRSTLLDDGKLVREAVFDRLEAVTADTPAGVSLWGDIRADRLTLDSDGNAARARANGQAIVLGADIGIGPWRVGAAYANDFGHAYVADRASSAKYYGDSISTYAGGAAGPIALRIGGSYTWYRLSTRRAPALATGLADLDYGQYSARLGQLFAEGAFGVVAGPVRGELFGRWTGERLTSDGFAERGGVDALRGAGRRSQLSYSQAGGRGTLPIGDRSAFTLSAAWAHAFGGLTPGATLTESSGASFTVLGAPLARDAARVSAALSTRLGSRVDLRVGYAGDIATNVTDHRVNAGVTVAF